MVNAYEPENSLRLDLPRDQDRSCEPAHGQGNHCPLRDHIRNDFAASETLATAKRSKENRVRGSGSASEVITADTPIYKQKLYSRSVRLIHNNGDPLVRKDRKDLRLTKKERNKRKREASGGE